MIVKPSVSFLNDDSDALLQTDTNNIIIAMTGNTSYPSPAPTLLVIKTALDDFSTACANAADGGVTLTAIKNDKRAVLAALLRKLTGYVQLTCNGDLTVLLTSGFPIQKPQRQPIGALPAPTNVAVNFGTRSGGLDAVMPPVFGSAIYNWRLTKAETPTVVLQTGQTTAARNSFSGLTPGVVYVIQANAVGSAGPSDWSEPVSQMAV